MAVLPQKTRRVKVVTGLKCNIRCVFCYYRDNLSAPNRSFADIAADLRYAYRNGVREVDFSGGEPTVHPDLPRLIEEARRLGMEKVSIISNGVRLSDAPYLATLRSAGLSEILFSVHGPDAATHDEITHCPGSFERLSSGMANAVEAGVIVRVNTVVNKINYRGLEALAKLVAGYRPVQVNFITINDWCFAKNIIDKFMLRYSEMAPALKNVCDYLEPLVPAVNVRYIPFCFMEGYERFVCDHRQVMYDPYEWVPRVRARLEEGTGLWRYLGILGYGLTVAGAWKKMLFASPADVLDEAVVEGLRTRFYVKGKACRRCRFFNLCDGIEKTYCSEFGLGELVPAPGEKIADVVHFRGQGA
ncbi:MAG TPA: radical SAM protein [Verrucomicrobiae bacterium]|nr:radical SAM protein [Verrucomicrobiae bacterium]